MKEELLKRCYKIYNKSKIAKDCQKSVFQKIKIYITVIKINKENIFKQIILLVLHLWV